VYLNGAGTSPFRGQPCGREPVMHQTNDRQAPENGRVPSAAPSGWKNIKNDRFAHAGVTSKDDLKAKAVGALRRLQKLPGLVRSFFADPHLRYITAIGQA
jgi:hypothetical protein